MIHKTRFLLLGFLLTTAFLIYGCMPDSLDKWDDSSVPAPPVSTDEVEKSIVESDDTTWVAQTYCTTGILCIDVRTHQEIEPDTHLPIDVASYYSSTANSIETVEIPEGQLFYSSLKFRLSVSQDNTCDRIVYRPYYYLMSNSADFAGYDGEVDCSEPGPPAGCWWGAATNLEGFPGRTAWYWKPDADLTSVTVDIPSGNSKNGSLYGANNRWTVNDVGDHLATMVVIDPTFDTDEYDLDGFLKASNYVGSFIGKVDTDITYRKYYSFECVDRWDEIIASVDLVVKDVDYESGSGSDHDSAWGKNNP